jgi:hypothetical protein
MKKVEACLEILAGAIWDEPEDLLANHYTELRPVNPTCRHISAGAFGSGLLLVCAL